MIKQKSARHKTVHQGSSRKGTRSSVRLSGNPAGDGYRQDHDGQREDQDIWNVAELEAMPSEQWMEVECPYCGESFDVAVDPSQEFQSYVEDCQVCCKPIQLDIEVEEGEVSLAASRS